MSFAVVSRAAALRKQTGHQFVPGIGYIPHASPPDFARHPAAGKNCAPPSGTPDGSVHLMQPPNGHPKLEMRWVAVENAWASMRIDQGHRLAWSVDYLSAAGWEYAGKPKNP